MEAQRHTESRFSNSELDRMLPHLLLPRKLPALDSKTSVPDEANLLRIMRDMVNEAYLMTEDDKCLRQANQLFNTWWKLQHQEIMDPRQISDAVKLLQPGDSFALYIRAQNASLLVSIPDDESHDANTAILSTFPASSRSADVMATSGDLVTFCPTSSIHIPVSDLLQSDALAYQLSMLSDKQCNIAMAKTKKAGSSLADERDVPDPMLISKLITATLTNNESERCLHFPKICKKVRDQINWEKGSNLPFRRSGLWFSTKSVLQLFLVNRLGECNGTFIYKMIILRVMLHVCKNFHHVNADISMQLIAKMAHRLCKIESYLEHKTVSQIYMTEYQQLRDAVLKNMEMTRKELETQWNKTVKIESNYAEVSLLHECDFEADTKHLLHFSKHYFQGAKPIADQKVSFSPPECPPRYYPVDEVPVDEVPVDEVPSEFLLSNFETSGEEELGIVLCDFEQYTHRDLDSYASIDNCQHIRKLFETYVEKAKIYYANDPVGSSQMVLSSLKIIKVLDEIAIEMQPLLRIHNSGIDTNIIKDLLLVKYEDLQLAQDLESYFVNRNQNSRPSLIGEEIISKMSFSPDYAKADHEMARILSEILVDAEKKIAAKKIQVQIARSHVASLRREAERMSHTYYDEIDRWGFSIPRHEKTCRKCSLEKEANNYKVEIYERPLPSDSLLQNAVIFELMIPEEIACLRDALYYFNKYVCSVIMSGSNRPVAIWTAYEELTRFYQGNQQHVTFGSTTKLFKSTYHKELRPEDHTDEDFIKNNGFNCHFIAGKRCMIPPSPATVKSQCTFSIDRDSKYELLSWTLKDTNHSQNEVLAKQIRCPKDLALSEFKEFGSLRAGHRLQLRNIYRALQQDTLSFQEESVFSLICQSVWQAGPQATPSTICRESHEDLMDLNFATALLKLLNRVLKEQSKNWTNYYTLLNIIVLTARILSLNKESKVKASATLLNCRVQAYKWARTVTDVLIKMKQESKENIEKLRLTLIHINVCIGLTFWVDEEDFELIMKDEEDVKHWLTAIAKIKDNIILNKAGIDRIRNSQLRNLLRWVRTAGVRLENHLHNILDSHGAGFTTFARSNLPDSYKGCMEPWESCGGSKKQIYQSKFDQKGEITLHMDIIRGNFLVNGYPVGYLPSAITNHEVFQRVFLHTNFEVTNGECGSLVTKYQNRSYSFLLCADNNLVVTETQEDSSVYQLVPHYIFGKDIPFPLREKYSHWWNKDNVILFRPATFLDPEFMKKVSYKLDLGSHLLTELSTGHCLIDVNTKSYSSVYKIMACLEHEHHVQVLYSPESTTVELPRLGLQFEVGGDGHLISREYPGMQVKKKQKFGTFIGLEQGLLLESKDLTAKANNVLLIPHGKINIKPKWIHHKVEINLEELSKPEFFAVEVDERLQELHAGESQAAWLYLALLHGATASPIADPFTGLTGTESALRLLQSAHCWSCHPMEDGLIKILKAIAKLSPVRTYYPDHQKCMETVKWPKGLSSLAAHDGYQMIAKKLMLDSQRLGFLFKKPSHSTIDYNDELVKKSYWRHHRLYTEQAHGACDFDLQYKKFPTSTVASIFESNLDDDIMNSVRIMAHLGKTWSVVLPQPSSDEYLKTLLISDCSPLTGLTGELFYRLAVDMILNLKFKESWLDMYNFARMVKDMGYECDWTVLLCVLAFAGNPLEHLQILHTVAVHPEQFSECNPPPYTEYTDVCESEFDPSRVITIFRENATTLDDYINRTNQERRYKEEACDYERRKNIIEREHRILVETQVAQLTSLLQKEWPTKTWDVSMCSKSLYTEIDVAASEISLNGYLTKWFMNRELKLFLENVEATIFQNFTSKKVHTKSLTQSSVKPTKQCEQYKFFELSLCQLLGNTRTLLLDEMDLLSENNVDSKAEIIFKTGKPHIWNMQNDYVLHSREACDVESFPWITDNTCAIGKAYMNDNKRSWDAYCQHRKMNLSIDIPNLLQQLNQMHVKYSNCARTMWKEAEKVVLRMNQNVPMKALMTAGLFPRIIPATLLPLICNKQVHKAVRNLIGAAAVAWTFEQQASRCIKFAMAGESMEVALRKELAANENKNNWSPEERPEWLLLELEMDFKIRPIQVKVANAMLNPEAGKHALMQLNMGEGKTAVIIPLVVASLSDGNQLCRVTVLKSLFHMNREALICKLGGLLNRRVYTFPCRRDMVIGSREASTILQIYQECVSKHGVVLTLPEHRLSFQLKGYEHSRNGNFQDALPLLKVQDWLKENARDVLDESDAILHVKYQLVYTVGEQVPVGGESLRWTVAQSLLKLVPARLSQIMREHHNNVAECADAAANPAQFPHCRLLSLNCYQQLCELLVQDILEGKLEVQFPDLPAKERCIVAQFLTSTMISKENHLQALQIVNSEDSTRNRDVLLILRGLLARGVLSLVLNKRWRVNYGVHHNGHRLMAVPYRAKDVAAERTEFGHPDVAILCTILSYYYSGLSETQLDKCFELLFREHNCEQEYEAWISKVKSIDSSIINLSGVNLQDLKQRRTCLQPAFLKNMAVVDFWLGKVVFPKECKQFGWKMFCSPWDLCVDDSAHSVTGFSGTNDTKLLLPLNISQKDLPELLGTNGEVLHNLLLSENNNYESLEIGTTNLKILERLVKENIPLLLDVGALMTEYSNKRLASEWLKLWKSKNDNIKTAAIYFDKEDKLVVVDGCGRTSLLELSPYRRRMEECIIYLDDFHTRGTDLKIPRDTKGCVTLGKGVTKDKLVQGCMRMRMLGEGHRVCFWASKEVDAEIIELSGNSERAVSTKDVLKWAMENSRLVTREGFLHWVAAGFNYTTKKMAHSLFDSSKKEDDDICKLGEQCSDPEIIDLVKMYGTFCQEEFFPKIARNNLEMHLKRFENSEVGPKESQHCLSAENLFNQVGEKIIQQCAKYIPEFKRLSHLLDEEQERELEQELEEERQVPRPPDAKPALSCLDEKVTQFIQDGIFPPNGYKWLVKVPFALLQTRVWSDVQKDGWGENIYTTKDFIKVVKIQNKNDRIDQFLRSPTWLAAVTKDNVTKFLLLSPFEVNDLMPLFRSGTAAAVLHMYAARLRRRQDTLLCCPELRVPSSTITTTYRNISSLYANLSIFSGNLYFADEEEQDTYANTLGISPRPRTEKEQEAFDADQTTNGFVKPEFRKNFSDICSQFQKNPEPLVRGIIAARHDYFPARCHVARLVEELRKPLSEDIPAPPEDDDVDLFEEMFNDYEYLY